MSTSFECDGCNHHASFHSMDNPADNEVIKRWATQALEAPAQESSALQATKRPRKAIENSRPTVGSSKNGSKRVVATTSTRGSRTSTRRRNGRVVELDRSEDGGDAQDGEVLTPADSDNEVEVEEIS
jgi:hypothetical protein